MYKRQGIAPTTSSISNLFKISVVIIATILPMIPMIIANIEVTELHAAVIETKPARGPKIT